MNKNKNIFLQNNFFLENCNLCEIFRCLFSLNWLTRLIAFAYEYKNGKQIKNTSHIYTRCLTSKIKWKKISWKLFSTSVDSTVIMEKSFFHYENSYFILTCDFWGNVGNVNLKIQQTNCFYNEKMLQWMTCNIMCVFDPFI